MTLEELISKPINMKIEYYEIMLLEKEKLEKKIRNISFKIIEKEDSLDVLSNNMKSKRYNELLIDKQNLERKKDDLILKLQELKKILKK